MRGARAGILALAILFGGAASAHASVESAGGYKYVTTKQIELGANKTKRLKASCPGNTHAYGGGQYNDGGPGTLAQLQTYPLDDNDKGKSPDDGWGTLVENLTANPRLITSYAVCGGPSAKYEKRKIPLMPNENSNEVDKTCSRKNLIGGGIYGPTSIVQEDGGPDLFMDGPTYYAYLHNDSQTKNRTATEYAVCSKIKVEYRTDGTQVTTGAQVPETVECPNKHYALNGGMGSTGGMRLNSSSPDSGGSGWTVFGDNTTGSQQTMSALVVCGKRL